MNYGHWDRSVLWVKSKSKMAVAHGVVRQISRRIFPGTSTIEPLSCLRHFYSRPSTVRPKIFCSLYSTSFATTDVQRPKFRDFGESVKKKRGAVQEEDVLAHPDYFEVNKLFTMRDLFNAGVHYGHHEGCWNPLMKPYLYGTREHMHIIDLNETVKHLQLALNVLSHIVYRGGNILFICTKPQFEELTQQLARECGEYFVTRRWRGGTFTNSHMVINTRKLPDAVVFLHLPSLGRNTLAVKETAMCNIPSFGIVDSDCNPNLITYPIPGNDDSPSAMNLYAKLFKAAILKAKDKRKVLQFSKKKQETSGFSDVMEDEF